MNIPIIFSINNTYIKQLATVIQSILDTCDKNYSYEFNILSADISKDNQDKLTGFVEKHNFAKINFIDLNEKLQNYDLEALMSRRDNYQYISIETYFRYFIPELFPKLNKALYLDADILVLEDISKLYMENIDDYYCAAIQDTSFTHKLIVKTKKTAQYPNMNFEQYYKEKLGKKDPSYFNAGVILLNLENIRKDNIIEKLWDFTKQNSPLEFQDQDALNAVFESKIKFVNPKWNVLKIQKGIIKVLKSKEDIKLQKECCKKPYIYHYVGSDKPWIYEEGKRYAYDFIKEWWNAYEKTPFYDKNDDKIKKAIFKQRLKNARKNFAHFFFSVKNKNGNKILQILGLKFKFARKPKKRKVALLIDEFFGGAGTAFGGYGFLARKYVAKYIPDENIQIDVLLERQKGLKKATCEKVDDVLVYRLPHKEKRAKKWLKKQKYDLFLSIEMTYPSWEIAKLVPDKKLLLWIQDPRPQSIWEQKRSTMSVIKDPCVCSSKTSDFIKNQTDKNLVRYISQGYTLNPLAKALYNFPENTPIQYLPNPIELDYSYNFDLAKKKKQVIFLGRLEAQKRAWMFCEVAKRMPEYEFFVMGKFHRDEENNKKPLEPYLNNDIPNLHFTGHLDGEEKEKLIRESRILLNTSIWEGIPISWLEALQYGTSIVSCLDNEHLPSRFGAYVGEILGDGLDKVDLFIPAIKELMENDELYFAKATQAIEYIRKTHNVEKFVEDFKEVINEYCA